MSSFENKPVDLKNIRITDPFWKTESELVRTEVIPYQWEALNDRVPGAAKSFAMHNFKAAGRLNRYLADRPSEECVVYIDVSAFWSSGFDPEEILPALTAGTDYTDWELLYENGLSVTYLLRK